MLLDYIRTHITESVKKNDTERSETLRFLLAAIGNFGISKYGAAAESSLSDADVLEVLRKQVKSHHESIDAFTKGNRPDLVVKEKSQLAILESYLPREISDEELTRILTPIADSGEKNFGLLMKQAMEQLKGKADGSRVKTRLQQLAENQPK